MYTIQYLKVRIFLGFEVMDELCLWNLEMWLAWIIFIQCHIYDLASLREVELVLPWVSDRQAKQGPHLNTRQEDLLWSCCFIILRYVRNQWPIPHRWEPHHQCKRNVWSLRQYFFFTCEHMDNTLLVSIINKPIDTLYHTLFY